MIRGKYAPLFRHLSALDHAVWAATFEEVEAVLGFALPPSARKHRAWWANEEDGSHSHARAWQMAGWQTNAVDLAAGTLVFARGSGASTGARRGAGALPASRPRKAQTAVRETVHAVSDRDSLTLGGQSFRYVARISPEAGPDGKPLEDMPQRRYYAAETTCLNRHGRGPFCRFSVTGLPAASGVYAVTVAQQLTYVGIAMKSLRERWGPRGYAEIQPRNCFRGGQSTNCKVNHAILRATQRGLAVHLWTYQTATPRPLEKRLIAELAPPWNAQR